ncbi:ABC transporter ATP-binding protein [Faecalimonas mobilis]
MLRIVKRIIAWSEAYKKRLYIGFVFAFITGIFMTMPIMMAGYTLRLIQQDMEGQREMIAKDIWLVTLLVIAAIAGRFLFSYLRATLQETVMYERLADVRVEIGNLLKRVNLGFFKHNSTGELVSAVTTDMSFLELHAMNMIDTCVNGYITMLVMVLYLFYFDWKFALIAIIGLVLSALFLYLMGKCSERNSLAHQTAQESMVAATIEYLRGLALVKSFHQEGVSIGGIRKAFQQSRIVNIKIEKEYAFFNFFHLLSLKAAAAGIVALATVQTYQGTMFLSDMILLVILSFIIFQSAENLNSATHVLEIIDHTINKLERILHTDLIDEKGKDIIPENRTISFEHVSFGYEKAMILKDVTCELKEHTFNAIVGPSGSGKTTFCNLIARFYDVNEGTIKIGGTDIKEYSCDSLLSQISIVFQKVYLFNDTIANNIAFGKPGAAREEIMEAAKKARCHDFIMQLPNQYDTVVNEAGASLSGGEKQRISIARAILKDSPIIILDEATSSVDPENEYLIQQAICELVKGKTVITIAHRIATIENADQILVMDDGRIVQCGVHEQLIQQDGIYRNFIKRREEAEGWKIE